MRPELVERVNAAIAAMAYQPDERARQLRRGVSGTLGAAVRGISRVNPVLRSVERAARRHDLMVLATSTEDDERLEKQVVMAMCRRRFDGLILEPTAARHDYLLPELEAGHRREHPRTPSHLQVLVGRRRPLCSGWTSSSEPESRTDLARHSERHVMQVRRRKKFPVSSPFLMGAAGIEPATPRV